MNDLSPPQSAARLSEDIGDVLGAIRRLIAEDDAMMSQTPPATRQDSVTDQAEALALRHGGAATLARRMVQDSTALRHRHLADHPQEQAVGGLRMRRRLVADPQSHAPRIATPALVARRDPAIRQDHTPQDDGTAPLRLHPRDRVVSIVEVDDEKDLAPTPDAIGLSEPSAAPSARLDHRPDADLAEDDFAEAFDAKARMRPAPWSMAAVARPDEAALTPGEIEDPQDEPATHADPFWAAYVAQDQDETDDLAAEPADLAAQPADSDAEPILAEDGPVAQPIKAALSIPHYLSDHNEAVTGEPVPSEPTTADEQVVGQVVDQIDAQAETRDIDVAAVAGLETSGVILQMPDEAADEETVRAVIREIIQEELHGELGERFSRNLRAVIRREVAAAIDEHLERL